MCAGGDGAPIDKVNGLTMITVSFLNSGKSISSPSENFILAAGDAGELDPVWLEVVREAVAEGETIARKTYTVCGMECRFTPRLFPADQKWLAHFAGELPNSATYFSSFADVSQDNMKKTNQTFSLDKNKAANFHPWSFEKRMADAAAVAMRAAGYPATWTMTKKHTATLNYLADDLKSRQLTEPALGKLVDTSTVDPLHAMNNAWEHLLYCLRGAMSCLASVSRRICSSS